jgi:chitinase
MINSSHKIRFYWLSLIVLLVTACGDNNENAVLEASKQHERDRQSGWLVGYIDYTRSDKQPTLLSAIDRGYNLIIIASASINADGEVSIAPILDKKYALKKQIKKAQQKGIKVLVSLGNENNIFNPIAMTAPESVAKNIFATLLVEFGFDGIDLNLENNLQWNSKQVVQMIDALKHLQKNVVITGSPEATIVIGRDQHAVLFSPQALWNGAEGLVASGKFDYILLEAYNQRDGISIASHTMKKHQVFSPQSMIFIGKKLTI